MIKTFLITFIFYQTILFSKKIDFNAMAPLHVMHYNDSNLEEEKDWALFAKHLDEANTIGVDAISVDVWWGLVEKQNNVFHWSYYLKIFDMIIENSLDIIPIMSFHSFDPGENSKFRAPVPLWAWDLISKESGLGIQDLKYTSEDMDINKQHKYSNEYISLWADKWTLVQYSEFIREFIFVFKDYLPYFQEINISLGPTGELRYPSYNGHDGGKYPNRGRMQCFSKPAKDHFLKWMQEKYPAKTKFSDILVKSSEFKNNIKKQNYRSNPDIQNLFQWYNYSLMKHGNRVLKIAMELIPENISVGFKMPGIHWKIKDPKMARISEMTCGLINAKTLDGEEAYANSLKIVISDLPLERLIFHFTCIEQVNSTGINDFKTGYSRPEILVDEVITASKALGLIIKGENSLSKNLYNESAWLKINNILETKRLSGVTIMRVKDISKDNPLGFKQYKSVIKKNK